MAEQSRSFRKFILDPKSSVMTYIADNIPQAHQQGEPGHGSSHESYITGQQADTHDPNRIHQNLGQSHANLSSSSFGHSQDSYQPNSAISQSSFPQPTYAQQAQYPQVPLGQAYIASNLSQPVPKPANNPIVQSIPRPDPPQWQVGGQNSMQDPVGHNNAQSVNSSITGPPPAGARRVTSPQSAQRQYHRMILDFERAKNVFSVAQSREAVVIPSPRVNKLTGNQNTISKQWLQPPMSLKRSREGYGACGSNMPGSLRALPKQATSLSSLDGRRNLSFGPILCLTFRKGIFIL